VPPASITQLRRALKAGLWKRLGRVPNTSGANAAKWIAIDDAMRGRDARYGWNDAGVDERVVEYAWIFDRMVALRTPDARILDAGSVMNHARVLEGWRRAQLPPLSIVTLRYEGHAHVSDDVRYEFADLRHLPYRDGWFTTVLCVSTIEHVGLDNTIYGAGAERGTDATVEAVRALEELARVTKTGGTLLLSVPFGTRSNRGWFRIFDAGDLAPLMRATGWTNPRPRYFRARREGWRETDAAGAAGAGYNEPPGRPGQQTAAAFVAAAEAVALVEMTRG
jgi:SAM-dependent methyltransferase